jgi:hypothetical protein
MGRNIERVAGGVFQVEIVAFHRAYAHSDDAAKASDAMFDMHYMVAGRVLGEVVDLARRFDAALALAAMWHPPSEELAIGYQVDGQPVRVLRGGSYARR